MPQKDGRYAPEEGNLEDIKEVISRAVPIANQYYEDAWAKCQEKGDVDAFLALSAALAADFAPAEPPRCALPEGSSIDALIELASRHGRLLLESLAQLCRQRAVNIHAGRAKLSTGSNKRQKATTTMMWRASSMLSGPQVFLTPRTTLSLAIEVLRRNVHHKKILIRRCKDHFGRPFDTGYRDLQFNIERDGFVRGSSR